MRMPEGSRLLHCKWMGYDATLLLDRQNGDPRLDMLPLPKPGEGLDCHYSLDLVLLPY
jgi:hypothetical protein